MNRHTALLRAAVLLVMVAFSMPLLRADIFISTIDFNGQTPLGLKRLDDTLQAGTVTALTAGDIAPFTIPLGPQFGLPFGPTDVAAAPNGDLYATDLAGQIVRFDGLTGAPLPAPFPQTPDGLFNGYTIPPSNLTFSSLTFGPDGRLYVVDSNDTDNDDSNLVPGVRIYDTSTGLQVDALFDDIIGGVPTPSTLLAAVAFTPEGNLLLSDTGGSRIFKADITTTPGQEIITELVNGASVDVDGTPGPDPFFPAGLVVDSAGDIYVANLGGNNLLKFAADGSNPQLLAVIRPDDTPDVNQLFGVPSHNPSDIAFDRSGNLLVSLLGDKNLFDEQGQPQPTEGGILRFDTTGNLLQTVAEGLPPVSGITLIDDLLPGDYNGDGTVDEDDYDAWTSQYAGSVTPTYGADGNGDGLVDAADYTIWRDTLGATGIATEAALEASQVPEPASIVLLMSIMLTFSPFLRELCVPRG